MKLTKLERHTDWVRDQPRESALLLVAREARNRHDKIMAWPNLLPVATRVNSGLHAIEWYARCTIAGVEALKQCVEVDPERRAGVPVIRGTRFTVAQLFAELSDSSGPDEVADNLELDVEKVRQILEGFALMMDKPFSE